MGNDAGHYSLRSTTPGVLFFLLLASACGSGLNSVLNEGTVVERLDLALAVRADGSLRVDERLTVHFGDASFSHFRLEAPVWRHDGIADVVAAMDGKAFAPGDGPGHVRIASGPALDVDWMFDPIVYETHTFTLSYTATNVVNLSGIRGLVSWLALPPGRSWDVTAASISLDLPESAILLQDPWVEELGWTVTRLPHGLTATRSNVKSFESATVGVEFTIDGMRPSMPQWQADRAFTEEFVPAFIAAALFILVTGAGILAMLRVKHPAWRNPVAGATETAAADALSVTPAMRLALMRGRPRGDRAEMTAALSGLVASGLAMVDADGATTVATTSAVGAHEAVLLEALPTQPQPPVAIATALAGVDRGEFRRAVLEDLTVAGLVDRERAAAARDLWIAGWAVMLFGVAVWITVQLTVRQFEAWPLLVPASILIVGLAFAIASSRVGLLSETGARVRMLYFARVRDGRTPE